MFFRFFQPSALPRPKDRDRIKMWKRKERLKLQEWDQRGLVQRITVGWLKLLKTICVYNVSINIIYWSVLWKANQCAVPNNEKRTTSFCVRGWRCSWKLDCPRATGWTRWTQSGSARCPAAASDTWAQTPRWHSLQGPPSTVILLPLRRVKHLATANKTVPEGSH